MNAFFKSVFSFGALVLMSSAFVGCPGGGEDGLKSIELSPASLSLPLGATRQVFARGTYEDGSTENLTALVAWASSDESVATVSMDFGTEGVVTAVAPGTATITADAGGVRATLTVEVTTAALESVRISPINTGLPKGTVVNFALLGTYSDGTEAAVTEQAQWSSSNPAVIEVSNTAGTKGRATARLQGAGVVSAAVSGLTASLDVTVLDAGIASISIAPNETVVGYLTEKRLTARATLTDGGVIDVTEIVSWESGDTAALTFSAEAGRTGVARAHVTTETVVPVMARYRDLSASGTVRIACEAPAGGGYAGQGTASDPYIICSTGQIKGISADGAAHYALLTDLDFGGEMIFPIADQDPAVAGFTGTFDGRGHRISGFRITDVTAAGLFHTLRGATIRRLKVSPADLRAPYAGAIAGWVQTSVIEDCEVSGNVTGERAGGIAGVVHADSIIRRSAARGVRVTGVVNAGGLVGEMLNSTVTDSYAEGEVICDGDACIAAGIVSYKNRSLVEKSWIATTLTGPSSWIVSFPDLSGSTSSVYFDSEVTVGAGASFATGLTPSEMKQQASFAGFDFETVWTIDEGVDYPRLR